MKEIKYCLNHPKRTVKSKGLCGSCYDKQLKDNNLEYKLRQQENSKNWGILNVEKKRRTRSVWEKSQTKEKKKERWLKKKYKLSLSDFREILIYQNNKCYICEFPLKENDKFLHVDHSHNTGKIRGLLCSQCNWFMSKIDKIENCFRNLENYIKNQGNLWKMH